MTELTIAFSLIVLGLGIFVWCWAPTRVVGVIAVALLYAALWFALADIMGRSKPILVPDEAQVISHYFDEPRAIHVWLLIGDEPRAYSLPWSQKTARRLVEIERQRGEGGTLIMRRLESEGEWSFHTTPPAELPPKTP
jgi:hypothetical protein